MPQKIEQNRPEDHAEEPRSPDRPILQLGDRYHDLSEKAGRECRQQTFHHQQQRYRDPEINPHDSPEKSTGRPKTARKDVLLF